MHAYQFLGALGGILLADIAHAQIPSNNTTATWYAGVWDSTLYAWSTPIHPRTVAIRIELVDADSRVPVSGAQVILRGEYTQKRLGRLDSESIPRTERREYQLTARTGSDGVVVFALSWQKEYPWSREQPKISGKSYSGGAQYAESWDQPVDDIEKVQSLEIRDRRYGGAIAAFDFNQLLKFGQDDGVKQDPELFDIFEKAWPNELGNPDVTFCALKLGQGYSGYGDKHSKSSAFFDLIRRKEFGYTYTNLPNLTGLSAEEFAGPYFVYSLLFTIEPLQSEDSVKVESDGSGNEQRQNVRTRSRAKSSAGSIQNRRSIDTPRQDIRSASADANAVQTVTPALVREKGLHAGTTGVFLNQPVSGLPAGIVVESLQHRAVRSEEDFRRTMEKYRAGDAVPVGFWKRNSNGIWTRDEIILSISN